MSVRSVGNKDARHGQMDQRPPFTERRRLRRAAARVLMRARTRQGLTAEQRALDPLSRARVRPLARAAIAVAALLIAAAIHVAVVGIGRLIGGNESGRRERIEQTVRVEVREPPPPPPPPVEEKKPEPPPEKPLRPPPIKAAKQPPPPEAPPPKAPARIVGLSLESTTEGGNGPAFAVGTTRAGETAERAQVPQEAPRQAPAPVAAPAPVKNAVASRIPVAGVSYVPPQFKGGRKEPPYPPLLKTQGIEGDVGVMVSIDPTGKVTKVKVIAPSTYDEMNESARATAASQEFEPATRDGAAFPYTLTYTYHFRLESQ
ncbi:MAG TPA: energy transducer TonB [Polyangia bacterium]|jgi:protein TonB|nr:energy transducer TonB [Polyangia bacterium]